MIKWIGQHIVDFIARFRSDVYLENIADGTVASDKFLGLDSNNKIVKETVSAGITVSDSTANTDFPVVFHDESNNLHDDTAAFTYNPSTGSLSLANLLGPTDGDLNIKSDGGIFLTLDTDNDESNQYFTIDDVAGSNNMVFDPGRGSLSIESTVTNYPAISFTNKTDDAAGSYFYFLKQRDNSGTQAGQDNDVIGGHLYTSYNDAGTPEIINYASFQASIADASNSDEAGKYEVKVTTSDGSTSGLQNAFTATGQPTHNYISTTIGYGAASVATIAGGFSAQETLTYDSEILAIGANDTGIATIKRTQRTSAGDGGDLNISGGVVKSGETNENGGALTLEGGKGTGSGTGGHVKVQTYAAGSSGTSLNTTATVWQFHDTGVFETPGAIELGHGSDTTLARLAAGIVTVEDEEVVTTLTRSLTSEGVGVPLALMQARRTLTEAELNDLHNTPITIVPAQGANTVIVPMEAMMFVDRDASTAQSAGASLLFSWDGNSSYATDALLYMRRFMYNESGDRIMNVKSGYTGEVGTSLTAGTNKPVKAVFDLAITSGSLDSMDVYLTYYVLNIS